MTFGATPRGDGNRIWRIRTPAGVVLQKLYGERGGMLHVWMRELGNRLRGGKTSTRAAGRRRTETSMLELWRAAGIDVPRNLSEEHPELHHQDTLVLEFVDGPLLSRRLVDPDTTSVRGQELIARYARELGHRHRLALDRREPGLVHEHGGVQHVLVAADRFVTIDLENAFLSRAAVAPLIHKELATALRSIARIVKPERFEELLPIFVEAYGQPELAAGAVRHYLHAPNPLRRLVWAIDRLAEQRRGRRGGKYRVLRALEQHLRARGG